MGYGISREWRKVTTGSHLTAALAALMLGEVLKPLDSVLKAQSRNRFLDRSCDNDNDDVGGESHPMGYIDDCGAAVPDEDVIFFFGEFN